MIAQDTLLVRLVRLVDQIPVPPPPPKRGRGVLAENVHPFERRVRLPHLGRIVAYLRRYFLHHSKIKVRHREGQRVVQFE